MVEGRVAEGLPGALVVKLCEVSLATVAEDGGDHT